ncbi:protein argonaute-2 [Drosophila willistoni]|uniref:protein argonaute-2 n=1 Tax=Drosophila willistoni TaxID=7260 RepID=UPI000C26D541|nr:protein argonaute-2 [Drosophila willistoni]
MKNNSGKENYGAKGGGWANQVKQQGRSQGSKENPQPGSDRPGPNQKQQQVLRDSNLNQGSGNQESCGQKQGGGRNQTSWGSSKPQADKETNQQQQRSQHDGQQPTDPGSWAKKAGQTQNQSSWGQKKNQPGPKVNQICQQQQNGHGSWAEQNVQGQNHSSGGSTLHQPVPPSEGSMQQQQQGQQKAMVNQVGQQQQTGHGSWAKKEGQTQNQSSWGQKKNQPGPKVNQICQQQQNGHGSWAEQKVQGQNHSSGGSTLHQPVPPSEGSMQQQQQGQQKAMVNQVGQQQQTGHGSWAKKEGQTQNQSSWGQKKNQPGPKLNQICQQQQNGHGSWAEKKVQGQNHSSGGSTLHQPVPPSEGSMQQQQQGQQKAMVNQVGQQQQTGHGSWPKMEGQTQNQSSWGQKKNQPGPKVNQICQQQQNGHGSWAEKKVQGQNHSSGGSTLHQPVPPSKGSMQQPQQGQQKAMVNQVGQQQQTDHGSWAKKEGQAPNQGPTKSQAVPPSQGLTQQHRQGLQDSKVLQSQEFLIHPGNNKESRGSEDKDVNVKGKAIESQAQLGNQQRQQISYPPLQPPGSLKRGTIGKPGQVAVNYLEVDLTKMPSKAYHYDVKIVPERPKKFYRDAFEQFRIIHLNNVIAAYDGRAKCYSVDKLNTATKNGDVKVTDSHGRTLNYNVEIKETTGFHVDLNSLRSYMNDKIYDKPMQALQCLEVVLAQPCHKKAIRAGRSFFKAAEPGRRLELGDGYECLIGLYQTFVLGDRPFVNVDISHKSFPIALPVLEYIERYVLKESIKNTTNLDRLYPTIEDFLKGIFVIYEPPSCFNSAPRVFKVNGLTSSSARYQQFQLDNKTLTVEQYFQSRNYSLRYPNLRCLYVGPLDRNIFLPIELCRIEDCQSLNRKDGANQVAAMIKFSATSTNERKAKIMNLLKFMQHNLDPSISRFGIYIHNDFIVVHTRTLSPPLVEYRNKQMSMVRNGSWRMDQRAQFLEPKQKVHKWAILHSDGRRRLPYNQIADFGNMFRRQGLSVNVCLEEMPDIRCFKDDRELDVYFDDLRRSKCDLVIVIIPQIGVSYDIIKQKAELKHGILTQCLKQLTVERKLNPQLIGNVLLKINSKLNGINHKLKDEPNRLLSNVMFLGADVTHPSPDQREIPSVVGVAASHDPYGAAYNMQYRLQRSALEEIEDMETIVTEHLRIYHSYRKRYPDHIVYYRDGVSDGQFPKIKALELRGINAACAKLGIKPKLCCVIVVKRHHTRFFPTGVPSQANKFNNVDPGTVVDRVIVHPNEVQFFMVSHQSIQGTAKPTRYNVIENTGNLDIDLLQQLTFNLCHMFPRCTRSVSYPAPAYLAHLVAARGRVYLTGTKLFKSPKEENQKRLISTSLTTANPMFFV